MQIFFLFFVSLFSLNAIFGETINPSASLNAEISSLDYLIAATKKSLETQIKLRDQIMHYQQTQEQYLKNANDNELLWRLVKEGHQISEVIMANYLSDVFSSDFLSELNLISQVASKRGIPRP